MAKGNGKAEDQEPAVCQAHPDGKCDPKNVDCLEHEAASYAVYIDTVVVLEVVGKKPITRREAIERATDLLAAHYSGWGAARKVYYNRAAAVAGSVH